MIGTLPPYPDYKESGVPWLRRVPQHWRIQSLGSLTTERSERGHADLPLLSVVREKGVILRSSMSDDENHNFVPDDLSNYKIARAGNLVVNKMKAWQGSLGLAPIDGVVSPAYFVFDFRIEDRRFGQALLRSKSYVAFFGQASDGVRIGQWDLSIGGMKRIPVVLPPPNEQSSIVRFLDYADQCIRRYIRNKQRLIAVLNEQKQAIINRAVTRGLDANVRFKPSGVPWLGNVPEHWELIPFTKHVIERADYRGATPEKVESGVFLVTAKNIRMGWIDFAASQEYVRPDKYGSIMRRGLPQSGDLLLTTEAPLGHVALVDREDIALAQRIIRFRMDPEVFTAKFALYSAMSSYFQYELLVRSTGSTAEGIKASKLPQLLMLQPKLAEQYDIVEWIEKQNARVDTAISQAQREISVMREYRTRLIADVVTGQVDVRAAAATLPDLAEGAGDADARADMDESNDSESEADEFLDKNAESDLAEVADG